MKLEGRLFVVMREAVGGKFASYGELAVKVHDSRAAEFSYNRLKDKHVMQPASIVPYVSLLHFLDLLRVNDAETYECVLDEEPTPEGAEELIVRKAVEKLQSAGFSRTGYTRIVKKMLGQSNIVLPGLQEIYQGMTLGMTETQFTQLTSLAGVRTYFGFSLVTRRVMLPTRAAKRRG